ncbi:neuronal acetylcholine receptor subunit alpha-9-like [Branchiostoma floridae]|uniref:Neuronal acetylcholine receptor subunit alpha-9-like n=1 Tax=Branchiostoma floridae TaxID=7739 RepID=A0A9J7MHX9_BRAFL|nr:neuronal acetylcholine receptor subunit alpha-9-like [Branchiostoma floridae]
MGVIWWSICFFLGHAAIQGVISIPIQQELLDKLFKTNEYNNEVRPVMDVHEAAVVRITLTLEHIIDMNEHDQVLQTKMWIDMAWHDGRLVWNPDDYGGMVNMTIKAGDVWRPDMALYDNVDQGFSGWPVNVLLLHHNGTVTWAFPTVLSTSCNVDVSGFPFDEQHCHFKFGSWMHDASMLRIDDSVKSGDLSQLRESAEWDAHSFPAEFRKKAYGEIIYDEIIFHLIMKRKWPFYFLNLMFPCFMLALLATLSFYLPAESGDKVSFGVTVLLALAVFLLMIAEDMPPSESIPLIGWYVIVTLVLLSLSLLLGSIVVNLSICTADTKPVPAWVRRLVLRYMSLVLCMGDLSECRVVDEEQKSVETGKRILDDRTLQVLQINTREENGPEVKKADGEHLPLNGGMEELLDLVRSIANRLEEEREGEALENDWKRVARVLDKFFMVLYLLTSVTVIVFTCVDGMAG